MEAQKLGLRKTVVGSFPRLHVEMKEAVESVLQLQIRSGIDIVSDGEQRGDMISYFSEYISGLSLKNGSSAIEDRIGPRNDPEEFSKVKDYLLVRRILEEKWEPREIKVAVTGPVTLGFTCGLNGLGPYSSLMDDEIYLDTTAALKPLLEYLQSLGALTQIDEPGLSSGFVAPENAQRYLTELTSSLDKSMTSLHVCGKISAALLEKLLHLPHLDVLSLAFASVPSNLMLPLETFHKLGKRLGLGCTRVDVKELGEVLSVKTIRREIRNISQEVGEENIAYVHPDCGLRNTDPSLLKAILHNMVAACRV